MADRRDPIDRLCDSVVLLGFLGLVALTAMVAVDVIARFVFSAPVHGVNDVSAVVVAVVIASAMPASLRQRRHITIRALGQWIGPRTAAVLDALGAAALLAMLVLIAWQLVDFTADKLASGHTTWILRWPTWPWWALVTGLFMLCCIVQFAMLWRAVVAIAQSAPMIDDTSGSAL